MKRILQVVSCLELGRTEAFIMNNYRQLNREEYQFDFMVFHEKDYPYLQEIKELGGRVFYSGAPSVKNLHRFEKNAIGIMKESGPYIAVHSHVNIANAMVMRAAYKAEIPKRVSHSHATSGKGIRREKFVYEKWQEWMIKRYATNALACSIVAGNYLYGDQFFFEHGLVIPNGINVDCFLSEKERNSQLKAIFQIPEQCDVVFGNISRFDANKNPLFAIRVFHALQKYYPNAVLLMGGADGGLLAKSQALVDSLGIADYVRFIGARKDIPDCLRLIDVYLFPSLTEGLGIGFLEAQASGCFCVASDGVSPETAVVDGSTIYFEAEPTA